MAWNAPGLCNTTVIAGEKHMNTATIEVQTADPAPPGKKLGKIKSSDGVVYMVWPDKLGLFRPGNRYEIQFSEDEFNGRTYRKIAKVKPLQAQPQTDTGPKPNASNAEHDFVARTLAALIQACAVEVTQRGLSDTVRMLRTVYRESVT